jgi:hypothetical protein
LSCALPIRQTEVLRCNNTSKQRICRIKPGTCYGALHGGTGRRILLAMSEADELARRFIALWAEYLTALAENPPLTEPLRQWLGLLQDARGVFANDRPAAGTAAAAGASGERDAAVAELTRRVDELVDRVGALERTRTRARSAARTRSGDRGVRR